MIPTMLQFLFCGNLVEGERKVRLTDGMVSSNMRKYLFYHTVSYIILLLMLLSLRLFFVSSSSNMQFIECRIW